MKNEIVIKVDHLAKVFKLPHEKYSTAKQRFLNLITHLKMGKLRALDNISFEVKKGEFFSIIGANGSGKSTLLKILAKIYIPTSGSIEVKSKVSPFIELGVGFNPELTARENVFLNAAILGLSRKETEERFDEIIKFAELEQFVDQKLKNFSSGMQVRLAFSIAIQAPAEILLVDEVLAVGDIAFQQKCFDIFRKLKEKGKTIVFVSHSLNIIEEFSDHVMYLEKGKIIMLGKPSSVIYTYLQNVATTEGGFEGKVVKDIKVFGGARIKKIWTENSRGRDTRMFSDDEAFFVKMVVEFEEDVKNPVFSLQIRDRNKRDVLVLNTKWMNIITGRFKEKDKFLVSFKVTNVFASGLYFISTSIADSNFLKNYDWSVDNVEIEIRKSRFSRGILNFPMKIDYSKITP